MVSDTVGEGVSEEVMVEEGSGAGEESGVGVGGTKREEIGEVAGRFKGIPETCGDLQRI